ncbi:MAG: hypothetical protein IPK52_07630 [Chloroflexi bacterium]|nr:hypothetical protein [Chloroflexota bacterium]
MRYHAVEHRQHKPAQRVNAEKSEENEVASERKRDSSDPAKAMAMGGAVDPRRASSLQGTIGNRAVLRMISNQISPRGFGNESAPIGDVSRLQAAETADGASEPPDPAELALQRQMNRVTSMPMDGSASLMRAVTAKKVFKKIGLGVVNLAFETFIGPLTDLKNVIRLIWEHGDSAKVDKVKERVQEEWIGKYGSHTWMKVLHAITTTIEKLGGLAGAISLLATLASIAAPAAAPIAAIFAVIGVVCAGIALIGRSILSGASFHYASKGESDMKKMGIVNLVGAIGNLLGVVSFGVGAGVAGGVNFDAQTTTTAGRDIGIGMGFSTSTKIASVSTDVVQSDRDDPLMRDPQDEKGGAGNPTVVAITEALNSADELVPDLKKDNREDRSAITHDMGVYTKLGSKFGGLTEKSSEMEAKTTEAESQTNVAESQEINPTEDEEAEYQEGEVNEMETHLATAETWADKEDVKREDAEKEAKKVKGKEGFFSRIKKGLKKLGSKIKGAFTSVGRRVRSAFTRFKALIGRIKAKLISFILSATGLNKKVAEASEQFKAESAQMPSLISNVETNEANTAKADAKLKEFR